MLRIAFASSDRTHVDLHFGGGERLIVFDVSPGRADLVGTGEFIKAELKGENKDRGLSRAKIEPRRACRRDDWSGRTRFAAKLEFVQGMRGCLRRAVRSFPDQTPARNWRAAHHRRRWPRIHDLLNEVSLAMFHGGLSWVERAMAKAREAGPDGDVVEPTNAASRRLITSIEELDGAE